GFPIMREAISASGLDLADVALGWHVDGRQTALVASAIVQPSETALTALVAAGTVEKCESCGKRLRTRHGAVERPEIGDRALLRLEAKVDALAALVELRTRHARKATALEARDRLRAAVAR